MQTVPYRAKHLIYRDVSVFRKLTVSKVWNIYLEKIWSRQDLDFDQTYLFWPTLSCSTRFTCKFTVAKIDFDFFFLFGACRVQCFVAILALQLEIGNFSEPNALNQLWLKRKGKFTQSTRDLFVRIPLQGLLLLSDFEMQF